MNNFGRTLAYIFGFILSSSYYPALGQEKETWITKPQAQWPLISMINEVWFQNGERYVHPSFDYVATGFLIQTGTDTLAVTAKHALWAAKTKAMKSVDFGGALQKWLMHPKNNLADSVLIDYLLNADSTEILSGRQSTITQRDWLVFKTKYHSPAIQPLKPRYTLAKPGEKVYIFACPYQEKNCVIYSGHVLESKGNRLIITSDTSQKVSGSSGSPIVDENGYLLGILGGSSVNNKTGEPALYGTTTHYLQKVLRQTRPLNVPLISIGETLLPIIDKQGIDQAVRYYRTLYKQDQSHFIYTFDSQELNSLADRLVREKKLNEAVQIYLLSLSEFSWSSGTYYSLGNTYALMGKTQLARQAYTRSIQLSPDNKEAKQALDKLSNQ
ncbi:trypsin-like peptidase domain-containing protein [Spirosoma endbachense]|uniref:Uncharacterized protein n=1 Tax=Spirosoma endbachense TaxID=2666025 RepID=A0A6P1VYL1_9BACT|nr:trypsin-like peptidase domain-containing protein [Spirosoma endbachense]QHV97182.1 hypothetical protein GJR95_20190 [Spirosoma endbachense]